MATPAPQQTVTTTPAGTPSASRAQQAVASLYAALRPALPGAGTPGIDALRDRGQARFAQDGLPTPRVEAWKYTNLRGLEGVDWAQAAADDGTVVTAADLPTVDAALPPLRLVFVNGIHRADLSAVADLPVGVALASLRDRLVQDAGGVADLLARLPADSGATQGPRIGAFPGRGRSAALPALADAFLADGAILSVAEGVTLARPVELVFVTTADRGAWHPRLLVHLGAGAGATLVEHHLHLGDAGGATPGGATLANHVAGIQLAAGARLLHVKVQEEGAAATHLATVEARVEEGAAYDTFVLNTGAVLARNDIRVTLAGTGATTKIGGAYAVRDSQHSDFTSLIDHTQPGCTSREVVKGVIDDRARGVFQGKIIVRPDAQKTDGHQLNRALLLSDTAEINAKPELEIYADDVKCSHGATAGELDEEALFYLRARGVPVEEARALLIAAFLDEAAEEIADDTVRAYVNSRIARWQRG